MLRELVEDVGDAVGFVVYIASYGPIYVVWNLIGKHVVRAFMHVVGGSHSHDIDLIVEDSGDIQVLRKMFLRMYYNAVLLEQQNRLVGVA